MAEETSRPREKPDVPAELWLEQGGCRAAFTPSEGLCCTAFRVRHGENWVGILAEPPSWEALRARPAFYGNPLLFPSAFGVADGSLEYGGQKHVLEPGRAGRVAHGFARDHQWELKDIWTDTDGAHLSASITAGGQEAGSKALLEEFPFPCRLTVTYTLRDSELHLAFQATNLGSGRMPMGMGIHPYFPLPLFAGAQLHDYIIRTNTPYTSAKEDDLALSLSAATGALDLREGRFLDTYLGASSQERMLMRLHSLRDVYTSGEDAESGVEWSLVDTVRNLAIAVEASPDFQFILNFVPPSEALLSPVVSTCAPNAFALAAQGYAAGVIDLPAGETWSGWARIGVDQQRTRSVV